MSECKCEGPVVEQVTTTITCRVCGGVRSELPASAGSAATDYWTYCGYNATLKKNGHFFAIVTPDGQNALAHGVAAELVDTLTRGSAKPQNAEVSEVAVADPTKTSGVRPPLSLD